MNDIDNPIEQNDTLDLGRRNMVKLTGAGAASLAMTSVLGGAALAQDMSNGADNFYTSDKVTVQKVAFRDQYQMKVGANLFIPRTLNRHAKSAAIIVGHPMRGQGTKRESVRDQDGGAGLRHVVAGSSPRRRSSAMSSSEAARRCTRAAPPMC